MEVVILNLGDADKESDLEILDLLNVLFSPSTSPEEKKQRLNDDFHIAMTEEFESEVQNMCNLSNEMCIRDRPVLALLPVFVPQTVHIHSIHLAIPISSLFVKM